MIQPVFGNSDQKFKGKDTIISGSVASMRSGNERGVNVGKQEVWLHQRGVQIEQGSEHIQRRVAMLGLPSKFHLRPGPMILH